MTNSPEKNTVYCARYRGEPGTERRAKYNKGRIKHNQKARGEVGSPKREAYNEKRRAARKAAVLAELEASRKHRESLWNFLRSKAA